MLRVRCKLHWPNHLWRMGHFGIDGWSQPQAFDGRSLPDTGRGLLVDLLELADKLAEEQGGIPTVVTFQAKRSGEHVLQVRVQVDPWIGPLPPNAPHY